MGEKFKKTTLQLITCGMYFMTAEGKVGRIYTATVNWVTQALFKPINVAVRTKADSHTNDITKIDGNFARNVMGKGQLGVAYAFLNRLSRTLTQAKLLARLSLIHSGMSMHVIKFNKKDFQSFFHEFSLLFTDLLASSFLFNQYKYII